MIESSKVLTRHWMKSWHWVITRTKWWVKKFMNVDSLHLPSTAWKKIQGWHVLGVTLTRARAATHAPVKSGLIPGDQQDCGQQVALRKFMWLCGMRAKSFIIYNLFVFLRLVNHTQHTSAKLTTPDHWPRRHHPLHWYGHLCVLRRPCHHCCHHSMCPRMFLWRHAS